MTNAQQVQDAGATGSEDDFEKDFYSFAKVTPPSAEEQRTDDDDEEGETVAGDVVDDDTQAAAAAEPATAPAPVEQPKPAAAAPAPAAEPAAAPAATVGLTDDEVLALVPADKADAVRALLASGSDAKHRLASETGRQAALQRLLAEQREKSERLEAELAAARTPADAKAAQDAVDAAAAAEKKTEDALSKEFPELSEPITMRIKQVVEGMLPPRTEESAAKPAPSPAPAPASQAEEVDPSIRYAAEYTELSKAYPNWQADRLSTNYETWIARQPAGVQALGDSENIEDAKFLLGLYERAKAEANANVRGEAPGKRELREHVEPRRTPGPKVDGAATGGDSFDNLFDGFASTRKRRA